MHPTRLPITAFTIAGFVISLDQAQPTLTIQLASIPAVARNPVIVRGAQINSSYTSPGGRIMTLDEKIDRFLSETREQRVGGWTAAPPLVRAFWLLHLDVAPPYYWSFATIALTFGATFGVLIFCFDVFVFRDHPGWHRQALSSAIAGALFGLFMAWYTRSKAKRLRLSPWDGQPAGDV